jgi:hypothetical protein
MRSPTSKLLGSALCAVILVAGMAVPASASPRSGLPLVVAPPSCSLGHNAQLLNGTFNGTQTVNGDWYYYTWAICSGNVGDIALAAVISLNGTQVDSGVTGFTGTPHANKGLIPIHHCAVCTGTWSMAYGQILKAPAGTAWGPPGAGCITVSSGLYLVCVQTQSFNIV